MDGLHYVQLHNTNGTLAVYRIYFDGPAKTPRLKRLRRWPSYIDDPRPKQGRPVRSGHNQKSAKVRGIRA